jgi:phage terminase large subunit-like protein
MAKSLAQIVAELPEDEREAILSDFDMDTLQWDWSFWGRPEQIMPEDDSWDIALFLAGRGAGKTRSAAEWIREKAKDTSQGQLRFLLVARTAADVREVVVEGESGIKAVSPPSETPEYKPSIRRLIWPNGNQAFCTSADEPDSLRGVQAHYSWGDEVAAWRQTPDGAGLTAFDNLRFATRLGRNPQIMATTTPKRVQLLYDLIQEREETGRVHITRGSTYDNAGNLARNTLDGLTGMYGGNRLGAQELMGELLDAVEGALWTDEMITAAQGKMPEYLPLRIIGVDPSVADDPTDECGIVAVGSSAEPDLFRRTAYVLEDASVKGSPQVWAEQVVRMARKWQCPVVAEVNQGGALVANVIHSIDPTIKVLEVHARNGKKLRAEPVALAYDQERVKHVASRNLRDLESQMTGWMPGETRKSPDRIDALVHGLTALLITPPSGFGGGRVKAKSLAGRSLGLSKSRRPNFRIR